MPQEKDCSVPFFSSVDPKEDFVKLEERVIERWKDKDIPQRYLERNSNSSKRYGFFDGPITANNRMGVHHAWGRFYKDLFHRFRNMQGYRQRFQNGFDGQGLWVEVEVEKELGFGSKRDIEKYGIGKFVNACKERVKRFADMITEQSKRLAFFMDWDNSYHTMSDANNYAIWKFLKICHERGWLYQGRDVMPWCTRCGTGLSQHEIVTDGYRELTHKSLFVILPVQGERDTYILVWTTTPWTIPCNVVASVHPDHDYVKVLNRWKTADGEHTVKIWLNEKRLSVLKGEHEIIERAKGKKLAGLRFDGPFDDLPHNAEAVKRHEVVLWDEVSEEEGTGIVHNAPACGAEDYRIAREYDLPIQEAVNENGVYLDGFGSLTGKNTTDATPLIVAELIKKGFLYRSVNYTHRYPVCWRCDTELIFRLVDEWFISMDELRVGMTDATKKMRWVPEFGRERELDWLKNMGDWMISKKRYWGLALPIFKCGCGHTTVIGSVAELKERAVEGWEEFEGNSPHRPWVDAVKIKCAECGELKSRIKDVGNPWLDAGIVPFSTLSDEERGDWYPAHWISESFPGQFRNWFYSLIAMSVALENKRPADAVFSYALMRDEQGREMHKSRGTAIWFDDAASKMGVDVMRWIFARQDPSYNLNFGYGTGDVVRRQFFIPLWNVYSFFTTYANLDNWTPQPCSKYGELDSWILSELQTLTVAVTTAMEDWRPNDASRAVERFADLLSNWYVRRSRRRFWKSEDTQDKQSAYATLYECLVTLARLIAPFAPFIADEIHHNLVPDGDSVHLCDFPVADKSRIDETIMRRMELALRLIELGRRARAQANIKTRQPLRKMVFELRTAEERKIFTASRAAIEELVCDELNVKEIEMHGEGDDIVMARASLSPNFAKIGPKYGGRAKEVQRLIAASEDRHTEWSKTLEAGNKIAIAPDIELEAEDLIIKRDAIAGLQVESESGYTVAIGTELNDDLIAEGWVREFVHHVQNLRRDSGFEISDRITIKIAATDKLRAALLNHLDYIKAELLAVGVDWTDEQARGTAEIDIAEQSARVTIAKV